MLNTLLNDLRSNARLRLWLALIVGAIGLYGLLSMRDALQNSEQMQRTAAQNITRLQTQLTQAEWLGRLAPAQTMAVQMQSRLWQAPTAGLAQAALQDWLNAALMQAKAGRPQVTVTVVDEIASSANGATPATTTPVALAASDGTPATPPDLWKIKAKIGFAYTAPSMLDFLNIVANHDKQVIVSTLNVRKEPLPQVEAELVAYFQKQALADKAPAPAVPRP